jgi:hypothetical protein
MFALKKSIMGQSKSSKYYASNPKARAVKAAYQSEFNKRPEQVKKRVELNAANNRSHASGKTRVGDGKDLSHTKSGLRLKPQSVNRGSKMDSPGDRRARGGKTKSTKS